MIVKLVGSVAAVTAASLLVWALERFAPTLSLGVVYVFAVLPVAVAWGTVWSLPVAAASMLAFNFFFLPPTHTFALHDSSNWFALAVFSATALVVSELAARSRRRAADAEQREREASVLAELAGRLLGGRPLEAELGWVGEQAAAALGISHARVGLDPNAGGPGRLITLDVDGRAVGTLVIDADSEPNLEVGPRFLPALSALLALAVDRSRLEQEAMEAEALRRSDVVKTALLRSVSHDLRSPLTAITTAVGALRNETLSLGADDRRDLLDTIAVDAERLGRLVVDLLDLSRLESGAAEPHAEVWALDDLVRETVRDLPGGERVDIAGESPLVAVDAVQIRRVVANLVENALKFSPRAARVSVGVADDGQEATVRVCDRGPGLADVDRDRVFEPFYRGGTARSSGAGLGLAIARGFAIANGGRVWAEPGQVRGATFLLGLPVVEVPAGIAG
jgi:two-component system sensor histidine kinase KdpD